MSPKPLKLPSRPSRLLDSLAFLVTLVVSGLIGYAMALPLGLRSIFGGQ